ncbi:alanine:cation symporter family protein [Parvularcula sp. ZS-1/3]|uniref:Alanine:cation symporter family protein n=1 Tax=Parvularcula mediterranea TaxID=2732508 RepID=A0A7Y3RKC3_9PROT|nr:alanine/glycine:cation symporter family protein [Parvularcula mediterranea]NNU15643.1 alanine:cation symporter family protein [Parvularcula mediterranea]
MDFEALIRAANGFVWSQFFLLPLLLGTGLFLTVGLKFMTVRKLGYAFSELFRKRSGQSAGDVSPFAALMTALSSTIGTGNIAGVAAAIAIGGPGAVFWMWMTAIFGMATKYSEGVLALRYREKDANGNFVGGPMYYIKNGMGKGWAWLGATFAIFGVLASWGTGALIQSQSISDAVRETYAGSPDGALYGLMPVILAVVLALGAAAVILGGVKRIAGVASKLVPIMAIAYLGAGLLVIALNFDQVPEAFSRIFARAFGIDAAGTGISIGLLMLAMQKGVARGIFSNEAGQGSAPIAHAAAQNKDPVNQGIIAMLGTVIDTLIVCTITALIILTSGVVGDSCLPSTITLEVFQADGQPAGCDTGAPLTVAAFDATLTGIGKHIVTLGLVVFGFTTILGWSYYGERCCAYLFSERSVVPFRISWILVVFVGALSIAFEGSVANIVNIFWLVADTLTGLMAAPNLVALIVLSPVIFKMTKDYFAAKAEGSTADAIAAAKEASEEVSPLGKD